MKINSNIIKKMRSDKSWSQEQLSELSGLSLRTIQRLESGGNASLESLRALAAAFKVDANQLMHDERQASITPFDAVKTGLMSFTDFSGKASRYEYWWFFLFVVFVMALGAIIHEKASQIVDLILLMPLLAAGTRRLNDTGRSGWLQLFLLVPFGFIIVLFYMNEKASETKADW